jgi:hypothetical protein
MAGLGPAIHVFISVLAAKTWMVGRSLSSGGPEPAPAKAGGPTRGPAMMTEHGACPELSWSFLGSFLGQKVTRMPAKPPTGAAGLRLRGLVAPGAWARNTELVGENVPNV